MNDVTHTAAGLALTVEAARDVPLTQAEIGLAVRAFTALKNRRCFKICGYIQGREIVAELLPRGERLAT